MDDWSWDAWKSWLLDSAGRDWRKPAIRKAFKLREVDPANTHVDFKQTQKLWSTTGLIYGIYHFATGRWYIGQTVNSYWERAQKHWYERKSATDHVHNALANELTPFSFVIFPLEVIEGTKYKGRTREATVKRFRHVATPRERYWVGRLNSMWPYGFNSAVPGKPVARWVMRKYRLPAPGQGQLVDEALDEVGRQVSSWLKQLESHGPEALREMKRWDKVKLRESLDWIQANVPADKRWARLRSVEAAILDELRARRACPPDRHYLKFHFGHQDAVHLLLRNVLRDPEVYNLHTEPEVGAAIMVCDKFSPQLQAILCNFAKVAAELDIERP